MPDLHSALAGIVIACFKRDFWFARIAIGSIRRYYPDVPIWLLKDEAAGPFSTNDAEQCWGVRVLDLGRRVWGNPGSRLSLLHASPEALEPGRYLYLDSDVCFLGPVLDRLAALGAQFIVAGSSDIDDPSHPHVSHLYYDFARLREFDPEFEFPGYVFNGGQYVFTPNAFPLARLEKVFSLKGKPRLLVDGIKMLDQGGLNYLLPKLHQEGIASVRSENFKYFASTTNPDFVALDENEILGPGVPAVAHWAGEKVGRLRHFPRGELLVYFNDFYYARIPGGWWKKRLSALGHYRRWLWAHLIKQAKVRTLRMLRAFGLRRSHAAK